MKTRHTLTAYCYDKKGRLISQATNSYNKTHPIQAHFASLVGHPAKVYLHAEILALIRAGEKKVHKIVITRFGKDSRPLNAKPCPVCAEAIKAYGIKFVSFTTGE